MEVRHNRPIAYNGKLYKPNRFGIVTIPEDVAKALNIVAPSLSDKSKAKTDVSTEEVQKAKRTTK